MSRTSRRVARKASKILKSKKTNSTSKSCAGSALRQRSKR